MDTKVEPERRPTSPAGSEARRHGERGFTLIEVVCVLALVAILAAIALPALPHGTSASQLESYAIETVTLLRGDHNAALRRQREVTTGVYASLREIRSGASGSVLRIPSDVNFTALLAARCNERAIRQAIQFLPSGMSCGGVIILSRGSVGYEVRVNWLTGGVELVAHNAS
jgi:general secretion pathway protein H